LCPLLLLLLRLRLRLLLLLCKHGTLLQQLLAIQG
jgi:hypothetical protein